MDRKLLSSSFISFVIGDLVTTYAGLLLYPNQIVESNPLPAFLINEYGILSFIPLKIVAFGIILSMYKITPKPHRIGIPIGLTAMGIFATVWNSYLLLTL